jgi:hypothetical protein
MTVTVWTLVRLPQLAVLCIGAARLDADWHPDRLNSAHGPPSPFEAQSMIGRKEIRTKLLGRRSNARRTLPVRLTLREAGTKSAFHGSRSILIARFRLETVRQVTGKVGPL